MAWRSAGGPLAPWRAEAAEASSEYAARAAEAAARATEGGDSPRGATHARSSAGCVASSAHTTEAVSHVADDWRASGAAM